MSNVDYKTIIELGFMVEPSHDKVFEEQYGLPYTIFYLDLTNELHVDWKQISRELKLYYNNSLVRKITLEELKFLLEVHGGVTVCR